MSFLSRFFVKKQPERKKSVSPRREPVKTYSGVELIVGEDGACAAAQAMAGKRFLTAEAPLLPVRGCDQPRCGCRYGKFSERRTETRRASVVDLPTSSGMSQDGGRGQRKGKGRRSTDAATQ